MIVLSIYPLVHLYNFWQTIFAKIVRKAVFATAPPMRRVRWDITARATVRKHHAPRVNTGRRQATPNFLRLV